MALAYPPAFSWGFAGFDIRVAGACRIDGVNALAHVTMERRIRPIDHTADTAMLQRVDVHVIDMVGIIGIVT